MTSGVKVNNKKEALFVMKNKKITGHLKEVNGVYHIVLNYYDENGKRKNPSISTKLKIRGNKKQAKAMLNYLIEVFEVPLNGAKADLKSYFIKDMQKRYKENDRAPQKNKEPKKKVKKDSTDKIRVSNDMLFSDFMIYWIKATRNSYEENTYGSYLMQVKKRIAPYFAETGITLNELTSFDIQDYYTYCSEVEGVKPNTILKRHANISSALNFAVLHKLIKENSALLVTKPKKNKFVGSSYSQVELNKLFEVAKGDPLELAIYLAAYYGLRREEVVGIKWDAINFETNTFKVSTTVTLANIDGKEIELEKDDTKNESSKRTYPLPTPFKTLLLRLKQEQETNKRLAGRSYNYKHEDYLYVDKLGNRIKPGYITQHFSLLLKKNNLRHIRFHDLRHTCATRMCEKGENLVKVQKWLGHSSITTTANTYAHLDFLSKMDSANVMLDILPDDLI